MAGIYLHIPFCKQACHYCDFHFSVNQNSKAEMISAIVKELTIQKDFLGNELIESIYFGGGTPSLLDEGELKILLETIYLNFSIASGAEITLEANPDDLDKSKLIFLQKSGINRLSIGIQSFHDPFLVWMNRSHNAVQSENVVYLAKDACIDNITIDLIYGIPAETHVFWEKDIEKALELKVNHISAYNLTIEPKTAFGKQLKKGTLSAPEEIFSADQFEMLIKQLAKNNFVHYEISNFGKEGFFSRHNSAYWKDKKYLGVGPSAHSYNGEFRQANISNNALYINQLKQNDIPSEIEYLSGVNKVNEYLLTGLRTIWGVGLGKIKQFKNLNFQDFDIQLQKYLASGKLEIKDGNIILSDKGKFLADKIIGDLFFEE